MIDVTIEFFRRFFFPFLLGLSIAACSTGGIPPLPAETAARTTDAYRLGLGDKLRINIYDEPDLSGEFQVSGTGVVNMPLIGSVPATGLTASELEQALVEAFSQGYIKNPRIAVEVFDFRPYYVLGEVNKPGQYPAQEALTIQAAIATAGDFTYRADRSRIFLRPAGESQEYEVPIERPIRILPGDTIRVGERAF